MERSSGKMASSTGRKSSGMAKLPAFEEDIDMLVEAFATQAKDKASLEFQAFKSVWTTHRFSFIHQACPPRLLPADFLQLLYSAALNRLVDKRKSNNAVAMLEDHIPTVGSGAAALCGHEIFDPKGNHPEFGNIEGIVNGRFDAQAADYVNQQGECIGHEMVEEIGDILIASDEQRHVTEAAGTKDQQACISAVECSQLVVYDSDNALRGLSWNSAVLDETEDADHIGGGAFPPPPHDACQAEHHLDFNQPCQQSHEMDHYDHQPCDSHPTYMHEAMDDEPHQPTGEFSPVHGGNSPTWRFIHSDNHHFGFDAVEEGLLDQPAAGPCSSHDIHEGAVSAAAAAVHTSPWGQHSDEALALVEFSHVPVQAGPPCQDHPSTSERCLADALPMVLHDGATQNGLVGDLADEQHREAPPSLSSPLHQQQLCAPTQGEVDKSYDGWRGGGWDGPTTWDEVWEYDIQHADDAGQDIQEQEHAHLSCAPGPVPLPIKLGALYCVYCLYETQPHWPRINVYLPLNLLDAIIQMVPELKANGLLGALKMIQVMWSKQAFIVGALQRPPSGTLAGKSSFAEEDGMLMKGEGGRKALSFNPALMENRGIRDALFHLRSDLPSLLNFSQLENMCQAYCDQRSRIFEGRGPPPAIFKQDSHSEFKKLVTYEAMAVKSALLTPMGAGGHQGQARPKSRGSAAVLDRDLARRVERKQLAGAMLQAHARQLQEERHHGHGHRDRDGGEKDVHATRDARCDDDQPVNGDDGNDDMDYHMPSLGGGAFETAAVLRAQSKGTPPPAASPSGGQPEVNTQVTDIQATCAVSSGPELMGNSRRPDEMAGSKMQGSAGSEVDAAPSVDALGTPDLDDEERRPDAETQCSNKEDTEMEAALDEQFADMDGDEGEEQVVCKPFKRQRSRSGGVQQASKQSSTQAQQIGGSRLPRNEAAEALAKVESGRGAEAGCKGSKRRAAASGMKEGNHNGSHSVQQSTREGARASGKSHAKAAEIGPTVNAARAKRSVKAGSSPLEAPVEFTKTDSPDGTAASSAQELVDAGRTKQGGRRTPSLAAESMGDVTRKGKQRKTTSKSMDGAGSEAAFKSEAASILLSGPAETPEDQTAHKKACPAAGTKATARKPRQPPATSKQKKAPGVVLESAPVSTEEEQKLLAEVHALLARSI